MPVMQKSKDSELTTALMWCESSRSASSDPTGHMTLSLQQQLHLLTVKVLLL